MEHIEDIFIFYLCVIRNISKIHPLLHEYFKQGLQKPAPLDQAFLLCY